MAALSASTFHDAMRGVSSSIVGDAVERRVGSLDVDFSPPFFLRIRQSRLDKNIREERLRGGQSPPRARVSPLRKDQGSGRKSLVPGVITHASNIVEHPELIAERLVRFAKLVGRENVMAGADCGFSSQALYKTEVHPTVVWEKFKAMRQGADLATKQLWK
jgi:methionine synthase II (cobalamin-independent)